VQPVSERDAGRLESQVGSLRTVVQRQQRLVLLGLVVASLVAPLTSLVENPDAGDAVEEGRHLFGALGTYFAADATDFGSITGHPYALPGGLWLTRVGLILIVLGLVAVVVTAWMAPREELTAADVARLAVTSTLLLGGVFAVGLGQAWLPDDEVVTSPSWGLLVVIGCVAWHLHSARR
jgi:hypothetical protein